MANSAPLASSDTGSWPTWAKIVASLAIAWQLASVLVAELTSGPSSPLEQKVGVVFSSYYQLTDQGRGHRFYSDIGPTPILLAELRFGDGRPSKTIRVPDRSTRPRMLYQRQLALANWVFSEIQPQLGLSDTPVESVWARSFAEHLCRREPGCTGVTIRVQEHRNPEPDRLIASARGQGPAVDSDSDEFYDPLIFVGDFPCPTP